MQCWLELISCELMGCGWSSNKKRKKKKVGLDACELSLKCICSECGRHSRGVPIQLSLATKNNNNNNNNNNKYSRINISNPSHPSFSNLIKGFRKSFIFT